MLVKRWHSGRRCKRGTNNSFTGGRVKNRDVKTVRRSCKIRLSSEKCHWTTKGINEDQASGNNIPSKLENN